MKTRTLLLIGYCCAVLCSSCIRSFAPDIEKYEELLVVDGEITDAPGPYTIKLSKSTRIQEKSRYIPYSRCKVRIEDDLGNRTDLFETERGVYETDSLSFQGIANRKYKLFIRTPDNELYESLEEGLSKRVEIKNVYGELQHREDPRLLFGKDGFQFYLDSEPTMEENTFLMWRLQSTYKFMADLLIYEYYTNGQRFPVKDEDSLKICYRTQVIPSMYILNVSKKWATPLNRIALHYEDNYTKALSIRYSLKVNQYTINERAFNYWSTIKQISDDQGDLYAVQPYMVKNNLINKTNPDKPALGYFTVAALSERRIFVDRPAIPIHYDMCTVVGRPERNMDEQLRRRPDLWPYFLVDPVEYGGDFWIDQDCLDCRRTGELKKPSFWKD